jgi:hypothetical protein
MKTKIIQNSLIFICLMLIIEACNKNCVPNKSHGSNTICCKINGVKFETSGANGGNNISCNNEVYLTSGLYGNKINAQMCEGLYHSLYITLFQEIKVGNFEIGGTNVPGFAKVYDHSKAHVYYSDYSTLKGSLKITELEDAFVAGEFNFYAKTKDGSSEIKVTEGKFDIAR